MSVVRFLVVVLWLGPVLAGAACSEPLVVVLLPGETEGSGVGTNDESTSTGPENIETEAGTGTNDNGSTEATEDTGADSGTSDSGEAEAICGDGVVGGTEECDDGLETATCNTNCTIAQCGDGIINLPLGEQCDAGGASSLCDDDCTPAACGDGLANEAAGEECDGVDLAGQSCVGLGFVVGTLACGAGCEYDTTGCYLLPDQPVLQLSFSQVRRFDFTWAATGGAAYYQLQESLAPGASFDQIGGDIVGEAISYEMPLHLRWQASYRLLACNIEDNCTPSADVDVMSSLVDGVGYGKASNTDANDQFGWSLSLSQDGSTLAVGTPQERSFATGIDNNQNDDSAPNAGSVYVFEHDGLGAWSQQAYIKASNTGPNDQFGYDVALSENGSTLAVGAIGEASNATGIDGNQVDDSLYQAGAVYLFVRDGMGTWSQQAYIKASNTEVGDQFGYSVALSGDGNALAASAIFEDSIATGINGNQVDNAAASSGAVYLFVRDGAGNWSQQAYVKASNTDASDNFGETVSLSEDGDTLAVGARLEDSNAIGIDGNQADDSSSNSGAAYVFTRDGAGTWSQQAYIKASNSGASDHFSVSMALSASGDTLAVGATEEDSVTVGINGNQVDNSASDAGAAYVFVRDGAGTWSQQAYVKASNTQSSDLFGTSMALNDDGSMLIVGADSEDSGAVGIGGDQSDSAGTTGAVYMFVRDGMSVWTQQAYIKASNTGSGDQFGHSLTLSGAGDVLVVGAVGEDGNTFGIGGDQANNSASSAGAIYLF